MTRDKKIALFIAPFLIVGGYIAADYYAAYRDGELAQQKRLYELSLQGACDVIKVPCLLSSGNLQLRLSDQEGITSLQSNAALDSVTFSYHDTLNQEHSYEFSQGVDSQNWDKSTGLQELSQQAIPITLRLIVTINMAYYFTEFTASGTAPVNGH